MEKQPRSESEPPDISEPSQFAANSLLWSALSELKLNIAQTALLCGISVRQIGYWTKQGYVKAIGRGVRRLYDLDAVYRILVIRQAMQNGMSLRQAVRALAANLLPAELSSEPAPPGLIPAAQNATASATLPPEYADALAASMLTLFKTNRQTRDNARGLAAKLGRSEEDIRAVAKTLSRAGFLRETVVQGDSIFRRVEEL